MRCPPQAEPVDVVLFEGWMAGFAPLPDDGSAAGDTAERLDAIDPGLRQVNALLRRYSAWHDLLSAWAATRVARERHSNRVPLRSDRPGRFDSIRFESPTLGSARALLELEA